MSGRFCACRSHLADGEEMIEPNRGAACFTALSDANRHTHSSYEASEVASDLTIDLSVLASAAASTRLPL